ncbi:plastid-lipid-associated protein 6, chloroplastic-like [Olea europaea var. sylvestris]|uniref:plastid-lipid-associated protein 6, chloroplastic-like n=1 Tax=Olea europaea var. sylvestris TaxID=158386 RepID=UPI000C1D34FA|nr:plastid-lipid-associated protein 6, chloroplastic-like [Olea europaea var. sylvestris]
MASSVLNFIFSPFHRQYSIPSLSSVSPISYGSISSSIISSSLYHSRRGNCSFKKRGICRSSYSEVEFIEPPETQQSNEELIRSLKFKLLSVVSGLNRGLAANEDDLRKADDFAKELESTGGPVDLLTDLDKLQGRWKLIYSSAFSSRTLGGSRPGPPTGRLLPITLGRVFQRIDILSKDFDNIVELELGAPWPFPPVEVTATLAHKFEIIENCKIKITYGKTTVKTTGNLSQLPQLDIPRLPDGLRPPSNPGTGEFEVKYLDSAMRITRGDRGELRVFVIS